MASCNDGDVKERLRRNGDVQRQRFLRMAETAWKLWPYSSIGRATADLELQKRAGRLGTAEARRPTCLVAAASLERQRPHLGIAQSPPQAGMRN